MGEFFKGTPELDRLDGHGPKTKRQHFIDEQPAFNLGLPTVAQGPGGEDLLAAYVEARKWGLDDRGAMKGAGAVAQLTPEVAKRRMITQVHRQLANEEQTDPEVRRVLLSYLQMWEALGDDDTEPSGDQTSWGVRGLQELAKEEKAKSEQKSAPVTPRANGEATTTSPPRPPLGGGAQAGGARSGYAVLRKWESRAALGSWLAAESSVPHGLARHEGSGGEGMG